MASETSSSPSNVPSLANCPNCRVELLTLGVDRLQTVRCSRCGSQFSIALGDAPVRTSRLATASLVTGFGALFTGLALGIPAIVLGWLALRKIRRSENRLQGRSQAIGGMAIGAIMALSCGAVLSLGTWIGLSMQPITDPDQVQALAENRWSFDRPATIVPTVGNRLPAGMRLVRYSDDERASQAGVVITILYYPSSLGFDIPRVKGQVGTQARSLRGDHVEREEQINLRIDGQDVEVTRQVRRGDADRRYRAYYAGLPAKNGIVLMMVSVDDRPVTEVDPQAPEFTRTSLSEDEVRAMFESYRPK